MNDSAACDQLRRRLGDRLDKRLRIEQRHEDKIAHRQFHFLHRDNWFGHPTIIRASLWMLGLYARGRRNAEQVIVRRNRVRLPNLPHAFEGFTLLHLSDLHTDGNAIAMDRVNSLVDELSYDICVMTGDYRSRTYGSSEAMIAGISELRRHITKPVFAVLGNHDSITVVDVLETMGIRVLLNEYEQLCRGEDRLFIAGVDDAHFFRTHDIAKAAAGIAKNACAILLSHTPEVFRDAEGAGFDLMLSGHTHGGQICLPGSIALMLDAKIPRRFGAGAWRYRRMAGYTSVGAGTSILPVRFNCSPEITLHELVRG